MNKSILIKGSIIMGLFLILIGAAVGCSIIKADATEPMISNGDEAYLTLDDFTITNAQLWEVMKNVDGLSYLMDYVDQIVLKDTIDGVTQAEVDKEIRFLTYLTESDDLVAEIQADADLNQDYIDAFNQNLIILGFDPTNADDLRTFVEVGIAKEKIAREYILNSTGDDDYALDDEDLKEYYESATYGEACAIEVRFESAEEASLVFDHFNLVPSFNFGIGLYTGTEPIEDVASDGFILDDNTTQLDEDQVFLKYVELYNYMNPWEEQIPTDITQADFCVDFADIAIYNFDDMVEDRSGEDPYVGLATYIFDTLVVEPEENEIRFSYSPQNVGAGVMYSYKISQEPITAYEDLTAAELLAVKEDILDIIVSAEVIGDIMNTINEDLDFEIIDPYLALRYEFETGIKYDNDGSETVVATLANLEITADDLFEYMEKRVGAFYSIELAKVQLILRSDAYYDVYGDDYDYMNSNHEEMLTNRDELREMKSIFGSNGYASYGFASTTYTWDEFIYLAFNVKTESEVIEQLFIMQDLQTQVIYPTLDFDNVEDYLQTQKDEYFSLNVSHLLIYVDFDKDFAPDDFDEFKEELTVDELVEYDAIKASFDNLLFSKLNGGLTFDEVVEEYEDSLIDDIDNEWAEFKQYGFKIMTENLSVESSLNNLNSEGFDDAFEASLKRVYDAYVIEKENSIEDITEYLDTQVTVTSFGIHLILATEGTGFEQPSAAYDPLDDPDVVYSDGSDNASDVPNEAQILLYNEIKYAAMGGPVSSELLPSTVYQAIDTSYGAVFNAYFSQTGLSIVTLNYMFDSNPVFATDNAGNTAIIQDILDVLYLINFPEGFVVVD